MSVFSAVVVMESFLNSCCHSNTCLGLKFRLEPQLATGALRVLEVLKAESMHRSSAEAEMKNGFQKELMLKI